MREATGEHRTGGDRLQYELLRLQLWHVFDVAQAGLRPFDKALVQLCPLKRRLDQSGGEHPPWPEVAASLAATYHNHASVGIDQAAQVAAEYAFDVLKRARRSARQRGSPSGRKRARRFGCFRYGLPQPGVAEIHFSNAVQPRSPFEDPRALARSLHEMCDDIRRNAPHVRTIVCGSWLNNLRSFRRLFPPSFLESLRPTSPDNRASGGWWGQFITHDGKLNRRRAELLKSERRFELPELEGRCGFEEFAAHVERLLESRNDD